MSKLNLTDSLTPIIGRNGSDNPQVLIPSDDGYGALRDFVCVCGKYVYQVLRPGWCGKCFMAKLLPHVRIVQNLTDRDNNFYVPFTPYRHRRETIRISPKQKFLSGFFPWYGSINNAHKINELALEIENLTALITSGFNTLSVETQALRNVALQNRMALDMLLASQGGVCHIIGSECCTYIPDITDNMTHVVSHLNEILQRQKALDTKTHPGFNLWAWLTQGKWWMTLLKFVTPIMTEFTIFIILLFCYFF